MNSNRSIPLVFLMTLLVSVSNISAFQVETKTVSDTTIPNELSEPDRTLLQLRVQHILEKDQQFRSYLSYGTTSEEKIAEIKKLGLKEQLKAMAESKSELSEETKSLLQQLQKKNDLENYEAFYEIVKKYGYPSPERIGVKSDQLFVLLLHPPVDLDAIDKHVEFMSELLLPEVSAGRLKPQLYATFIDNMRGKIQRRPQLYGTNQQYDRASGKVLPPLIADIEKTNSARLKLGLPELKQGEFRLASSE